MGLSLKICCRKTTCCVMPYELIVFGGCKATPLLIIPEVIICIPTIKCDIDSKMFTKVASSNVGAIIIIDKSLSPEQPY